MRLLVVAMLGFSLVASAHANRWLESFRGWLVNDGRVAAYDLHRGIVLNSTRFGVPPNLVAAVISVESLRFDPCSLSRKGAMGLMQLHPFTAHHHLGLRDPYVPAANLEGGVSYLAEALDASNHNLFQALAFYNFGPRALSQSWPAETRNYIDRISALLTSTYTGERWRQQVPQYVPNVSRTNCVP